VGHPVLAGKELNHEYAVSEQTENFWKNSTQIKLALVIRASFRIDLPGNVYQK